MDCSKMNIDELRRELEKEKKQKRFCDVQQQAKKVMNNSFYGSCANSYFRWFDLRIPTSITLTGQWYLKTIAEDVNNYLKGLQKLIEIKSPKDCVVMGDTDSVFFSLDFLTKKEKTKRENADIILKVCDRINKFIKEKMKDYSKERNSFECLMDMKRENIIDKMLVVAKKRYVCNVLIDEGGVYDENRPHKIMGLELIKASTPRIIRDKLKESVYYILNEDEEGLTKFVKQVKSDFKSFSPEIISFPRGVSNITKWKKGDTKELLQQIKSGTPIHVKGSIFYNWLLDKMKDKGERIRNGDKIKYIYLKDNPSKVGVISFLDKFPSQYIYPKFIDYDKQFEKTFMDVIKILVSGLNWDLESGKKKLSSFFK
jgi:DNA polymerase elongation subunit (family B)